MTELYQVGTILWILCFTSPWAKVQGITCLDCNDVAEPKYCQATIECGKGEVCSVTEFTNFGGKRGFRLGCEDNKTCELVQKANTPSDTCFECCSTDMCNNDLCHGSSHTPGTNPGLTCVRCEDAKYPEHCRQTTVCGSDEICYTREYTDHKGLQAYRLGCESKTRCNMILKANPLIGKRHQSDPAPPGMCYNCCSTDECNSRMCQVFGGNHTGRGCPGNFVAFQDNCYLFVRGAREYVMARGFCHGLRAELVSVHTKDENDFIAYQLTLLNDTTIFDYWTAGIRPHETLTWEYVDHTPFDYEHWGPGFPYIIWSAGSNYYLTIGNPAHSRNFQFAPMFVKSSDGPTGVMCEKRHV